MHDVSIPAALIAVSSASFARVLPLCPLSDLSDRRDIEHVNNDEATQGLERAVMAAAVMFVLGFTTVFVALGASASLIGADPGLVGTTSTSPASSHHHGPAFPRADPDRAVDARGNG